MSYISKIDLETAGEAEKKVIEEHLAQGYKLSNEKLTLLHNIEAFKAIEESSYSLDRELQRLIGKRAGDFFEYFIEVSVAQIYPGGKRLAGDVLSVIFLHKGNGAFHNGLVIVRIAKLGAAHVFVLPENCDQQPNQVCPVRLNVAVHCVGVFVKHFL